MKLKYSFSEDTLDDMLLITRILVKVDVPPLGGWQLAYHWDDSHHLSKIYSRGLLLFSYCKLMTELEELVLQRA